MEFKYYQPSAILKPYIRHFYLFESPLAAAFNDTVFPSGDMELIFNLGAGSWEASKEGILTKNPEIELWGQTTKPLPIRSAGKQTMLGVRFFQHAASCFLNDEISTFNDQVTDFTDVAGRSVRALYEQLLNTYHPQARIGLVDAFLVRLLVRNELRTTQIDRVHDILTQLTKDSTEISLAGIAARHGITTRYLHKLVSRHTGLSPKSLDRINRFQASLKLINQNNLPLTAVAYHSGYFDQSHFIREFKAFTGTTPSAYLRNISPVNQILAL
nr:helix-turn-helix transcriptional regulator [uncultured Dyadobacter sp.]